MYFPIIINWTSPFPILGLLSVFFFIFIQILKETSVSKPDQTPRFVASNLVLHCLPMSHKKTARLIWVNQTMKLFFSLASACFRDLM